MYAVYRMSYRMRHYPAWNWSSGRPRKSYLEARRSQAISWTQERRTQKWIAEKLGVEQRTIRRWVARHRHGGQTGLVSRPISGRPRMLSKPQERWVKNTVRNTQPQRHGLGMGSWTHSRIVKLIWRRFRVKYHVDHVSRLLKRP